MTVLNDVVRSCCIDNDNRIIGIMIVLIVMSVTGAMMIVRGRAEYISEIPVAGANE